MWFGSWGGVGSEREWPNQCNPRLPKTAAQLLPCAHSSPAWLRCVLTHTQRPCPVSEVCRVNQYFKGRRHFELQNQHTMSKTPIDEDRPEPGSDQTLGLEDESDIGFDWLLMKDRPVEIPSPMDTSVVAVTIGYVYLLFT